MKRKSQTSRIKDAKWELLDGGGSNATTPLPRVQPLPKQRSRLANLNAQLSAIARVQKVLREGERLQAKMEQVARMAELSELESQVADTLEGFMASLRAPQRPRAKS